jgi:hypothetical protein
VYLLVFHAYINEMRGSRSKILSKILVRQCWSEGFNSGVKGLSEILWSSMCTYVRCELVVHSGTQIPYGDTFVG